MTYKSSLLVVDLSVNIVFSVVIVTFGILLLTHLKIRLNLLNRIKWIIALCALILRLGLTIDAYAENNYTPTTTKYYLYWILEQSNFMIMLILFLSVIGSWQIVAQFNHRNQLE